ncbi:MAG: RNA pseudouridine synthase, partial [Pelagibacteraceae bacterium]|nr:RNA pseudouridine synthase [Pelagibacteraceae bacterium]
MFVENNENFVVINKPAGIAVQSGTKSRRNILDILRNTKEFEGASPYAVHRIDKETTGVLVVAKNRKYAQLF